MVSITNIFPITPIPEIENPSDELLFEISDFIGKKYTDLKSRDFRNYSVFFFLPENAFVYYMPALILASYAGFEDCRVCIEYTIDLFISDREFQRRWKGFSLEQRSFIADWINTIRKRFDEDDEIFLVAIDILRGDDRYWLA